MMLFSFERVLSRSVLLNKEPITFPRAASKMLQAVVQVTEQASQMLLIAYIQEMVMGREGS